MKLRNFLFFLIILSLVTFLGGCDPKKAPFQSETKEHKILVYAAMAVSDPVQQLIADYNKTSGCYAEAIYGGSTHIRRAVEISRKGDIFFPGLGVYVDDLEKKGLISSKFNIGFYKLSYFVKKGNPLGVKGDLSELLNPSYKVGIGDFASSGIGRATKDMLVKAGIFHQVQENAVIMTADSKELYDSLLTDKTDLVVDWSNFAYSENSELIQPIEINSIYSVPVPITVGILKSSKDMECSEKFVRLVASEKGREIFGKYNMGGLK